ncbi:hypothetical protein ACFRCI_37165 [Streptomyces sp. NPDC056638]|uniref:hypothetical protein n=1 Tax=Streptomyces sp. NPDC056638 TaxID=3345887 RepID=UPI0036895E68
MTYADDHPAFQFLKGRATALSVGGGLYAGALKFVLHRVEVVQGGAGGDQWPMPAS